MENAGKEKTLGYFGLGNMGLPMCVNLVRAGYRLLIPAYRYEAALQALRDGKEPEGYDRKKLETISWMLENGAESVRSAKELAQQADIVILCVPTSRNVESLMYGEDGIIENIRPGSIVIDMTSAEPESTKQIAALLEEKGAEMLDAPVTGGVPASESHTLTIMVGGKKEIFEKAKPVLDELGIPEKVRHVGPHGAGHVIKAANNFMSAGGKAMAIEALLGCVAGGVDPRVAQQVIAEGSGMNMAMKEYFPYYLFGDHPWCFTPNLMRKDVRIFNTTAKAANFPTFISDIVYQIYSLPAGRGKGDDDLMEVFRQYEEWTGVKLIGIEKE